MHFYVGYGLFGDFFQNYGEFFHEIYMKDPPFDEISKLNIGRPDKGTSFISLTTTAAAATAANTIFQMQLCEKSEPVQLG